ncbi:MAG: hypothetical protein JNG88_05020 [Phycisphaerales bacterium]|nr:hypothetical protein [Phycisphaerales bacterium]
MSLEGQVALVTGASRGIGAEILAFQNRQQGPAAVAALFAPTEADCRQARRLVDDLAGIERRVSELRRRITTPDAPLGHKK